MFITAAAPPRTERKAERHMRGPEVVRNKMVHLQPQAPNRGNIPPRSITRPTLRRTQQHHQFKFVPVCPGKAPIRWLFGPAFPAARGLCGNGRKAKTGGMYG